MFEKFEVKFSLIVSAIGLAILLALAMSTAAKSNDTRGVISEPAI